MNTADRSVEALDTALRRRFSFVEMMPDPSLLDKMVFNSISLQKVLEIINERIEVLKDREHQIGHSYFMRCKNLDDVKQVFKNNIIPLLQEYFYGDYEKIKRVLGAQFVQSNKPVTFADGTQSDTEQQYRMLSDSEWKSLDIEQAINRMLYGSIEVSENKSQEVATT